MILVADSGSTNTDWVIIRNDKIIASYKTKGLNPYFTESDEITKEVTSNFPDEINPDEITKVFFYGAGCSSNKMNSIILYGLKPFFTNSEIIIEHDLLAAARSLFINEPGIAVILGTGSNTCLYDGKNIIKNVTSLGYILGDEGGGDHLGKIFITDFLNNDLPHNIHELFIEKFDLSKEYILDAVYKKPFPNKFLASFTKFIAKNSHMDYFKKIIKKSFNCLFEKHICKYKNYNKIPIRITGSVAYYFENQLKEVANEYNAKIDLIEKEPIKRLASYHIKNNPK